MTRTVLFICVENAGRSLMAEAMFNAHPPAGWHAISAGTQPAYAPNPRTATMLQEIGLEIPAHPPTLLTNDMMTEAGARITMGCLDSESCPARLKTLEVTDWALPDPAKLDDAGFRAVRDDLARRVEGLSRDLALRDRMRPQFGRRETPS
ncbi:MAG: low molecular weight phosphatase family protein [Thermoplasmata archaeon]|nr:low molecular weight phosphatase family protein [Thermoplasmata archaeon]